MTRKSLFVASLILAGAAPVRAVTWESSDAVPQFRAMQAQEKTMMPSVQGYLVEVSKKSDENDRKRMEAVAQKIANGEAVDPKELAWAKKQVDEAIRQLDKDLPKIMKEIEKQIRAAQKKLPKDERMDDDEIKEAVQEALDGLRQALVQIKAILDGAETSE